MQPDAFFAMSDEETAEFVRKNGSPLQGLHRVLNVLGRVELPRQIASFHVRENDLLEWVVTNLDVKATGQLVKATFGGWAYPKELDPPNVW